MTDRALTKTNAAILESIERHRATFHEDGPLRWYEKDGKSYFLTVTGVLDEAGFYRFFREDPDALERGSTVHKILEYFDQGDLDEASVDPTLMPYVAAYRKALELLQPRAIVGIEVPLVRNGVGGRFDRLWINAQGAVEIVDIKTGDSAPSKCWALQTMGYADLGDVAHRVDRRVIQLKSNGQFATAARGDSRIDWRAWVAARDLALWKRGVK